MMGSQRERAFSQSDSAARTRSAAEVFIAREIFKMFSSERFRSPRSTSPMYVRWRPERFASSSWEIPRSRRWRRISWPKAWWAELRGFILRGEFPATAYKSTDYKWHSEISIGGFFS